MCSVDLGTNKNKTGSHQLYQDQILHTLVTIGQAGAGVFTGSHNQFSLRSQISHLCD